MRFLTLAFFAAAAPGAASAWSWPATPAQIGSRARPQALPCARPVCLRAAKEGGASGGAQRGQEEAWDASPFKAGKSRYEAFYEGQGVGGADGAIDTTAEDILRCVCACAHTDTYTHIRMSSMSVCVCVCVCVYRVEIHIYM